MTRKAQLLKISYALTASEETAEKFAQHLEELFDVLVPERIGPAFIAALQANDYAEAVKQCAAYYREKAPCGVPSLMAKNQPDIAAADKAVAGKMRVINVDWEFPDGELDYYFDPTMIHGPRNYEWVWQFNRHGFWPCMANTYYATGDEKYAAAFSRQMLKWVAQTYISKDYNDVGSAWRTIECGLRLLGSWPVAFDAFRKSKSLSDTALLLMIASMHRQSVHLVKNPTGYNWLMMEANGVYTMSSLFDELSDSESNRKIAAERLLRETEKQMLPDGMHNELSPDYQIVVFSCAYNFYVQAQAFGFADELPAGFARLLEKTVDAAILLSTPGFTQPRTNDCYTIHTKRLTQGGEHLFGKKPAYVYVNTDRQEGAPPEGETASHLLPYAGFAVMRTDWTEDAAYLCFDVGPLGAAHMHQDKLNINLYKGNQELIYDDGGGQYEVSAARTYGVSGYAHNIAMVDGLVQRRKEPKCLEEPVDAGWITNAEFDYAEGLYDSTFGAEFVSLATHFRQVRFCKPGFFCVTDTLTSVDGKAHDYEIMFHLDTQQVEEVAAYKNAVISNYGKKYDILIVPLDEEEDKIDVQRICGQTEPVFQGWYNGRNESNCHKATTVIRGIHQVNDCKFTTLLFPVTADTPLPQIKKDADGTVHVDFDGKQYSFSLNALNR